VKGQIVSGKFGEIIIRKKSDEEIEIGELLICETETEKIILQVYDLSYGSQISSQNLELISGMHIEEQTDMQFFNEQVRNYVLAKAKNILSIKSENALLSKSLPTFLATVRQITKEDLSFLTIPREPLLLGKLRSGSDVIDIDIALDGAKVFQHHILIPATTGRGKSNLVKTMLWNVAPYDYCGILVLDPHDEYYGRTTFGLKDHMHSEKMVYYSKNPLAGTRTLKINVKSIRPNHFHGVVQWSDPQQEALWAYFKKYKEDWIEAILFEKDVDHFQEGTLQVVKRKLLGLLDLVVRDNQIYSNGVFDPNLGINTVKDIVEELERSRIVIIDTSAFSGSSELLIGSLVAHEILTRYKFYKMIGTLESKPVISIVLEEAPRVIGKDVLERGTNVFEQIAREGRKFKVGLTAITQLPSLIPREILANMNTKIILGIEMGPERQAVIESSAQDLSDDARAIAALDKGEAIITSHFTRCALPIKIPLFEDLIIQKTQAVKKTVSYQKQYLGIELL